MYTLKKLLLFALLCGSAALAQAQNNDDGYYGFRHLPYSVTSNLMLGIRSRDLSQLNRSLNANGITAVSGNNPWFGLSVEQLFRQRLNLELGVAANASSSGFSQGIEAHYLQSQLFMRFGYNLTKTDNFRFYPFLGLNLSYQSLNLKDNLGINRTSDFNNTLLNYTASKTLDNASFGVELGLGYAYYIPLKTRMKGNVEVKESLPIGLRAGYYLQATSDDWYVEDHALTNGPDKKGSNVFVTLTVGIGTLIRRP